MEREGRGGCLRAGLTLLPNEIPGGSDPAMN